MIERRREPQSIGGVLDTGFGLFRAGFAKLVPITYAAALLSGVWSYIVQIRMAEGMQQGNSLFNSGFMLLTLVGLLIFLVLGALFAAAAVLMARAVYVGESLQFGGALARGWRRVPAVVGASILYPLATALGTLALVVPGLYLAVALSLCFYAASADQKGPAAALGYSYSLVKGNWWRAAAVLTVIGIIAIILYFGIGLVAGIGAFTQAQQVPPRPSLLTDLVITPILSGLITPMLYCLGFALYEDLKLRSSGADLADRLDALEST